MSADPEQPERKVTVPEDLDALRDSLAVARREREKKEREFDQFVRAFREAPPAPPPQPARRIPPALLEPPRESYRPARKGRRRLAVASLIAGAVLVAGWAGWWPGRDVVAPETQPASTPAVAPTAGTASAPAPQVAPPPAARPLVVELVTDRPVWMRVTVDDERRFEREVPAGQKIALEADRRIVVRAGDAGGVRVVVNGRDQGLLGGNGQVVTRTLTPPPQPAR